MLKSEYKLEYALLSVFLMQNIVSTMSPMLPSIAVNLPGGEDFSKLLLTLPSIVAIPFILISPFFLRYFSKKILILTGLLIYVVVGILSVFFVSPTSLFILRALVGVGIGLTLPYATALITEYYKDEKKDEVLSKSGMSGYTGAIILLLLTGVLTNIYWAFGFLAQLISIIPIYLISTQVKSTKKSIHFHKYPFIFNLIFKKEVFFIILSYFIIVTLVGQYFLNISFVIKENNIGSSIHSAVAQVFFLISGVVSNYYMNIIKKISSELLYAFQMLFIAQGFFVFFSPNLNMLEVCFASFLIGLGFGSFGVSMMSLVIRYTTRINKAHTISLAISAMYFGNFASHAFLSDIFIIFNIKTYYQIFFSEGLIFLLLSLILFIKFLILQFKKKKIS